LSFVVIFDVISLLHAEVVPVYLYHLVAYRVYHLLAVAINWHIAGH